MSTPRVLFLWIVALLALPSASAAMEPEQREVVVISARVWEGHEYREIFVPSTKAEMTVIAGRDSAISFVRTLEYYWPLSRQVYVDFKRQREVLDGDLVIRRGAREIARQPLAMFSILYPKGAVNGDGRLLWGEEAVRAFTAHQEGEQAFARNFAAARRAHSQYERRLVHSGAMRRQGEPAEAIEPPAPLPEPSLRLVTEPQPGFRLSLEPGAYVMALESGGLTVPGSERTLRVVSLAESDALVADVVPAERWTRPLASNAPAARIFARPGAVFYMTLAEASLFDEADYLPVVSPQADAIPGRPLWIRRTPSAVEELRVDWAGQEPAKLQRRELKVEQTRGSSFGYRVRTARDGEATDMSAFVIDVPDQSSVTRGTIDRDEAAGAGFEREVVVVHPRRGTLGLVIALLPLFVPLARRVWLHRTRSKLE
ncbi:MAG TPA: hypothetical protein VGO17_01420 [Aurantimonas sp.]|jgi:hypothetical protein|nr:hypothetical protein [Aurantimonas sp.]